LRIALTAWHLLAALLSSACSSPARDSPVVPEGLRVMALAGGTGVLEVAALTLQKAGTTTELLAALRNTGDVPACHAAFSVELFDGANQSLAAGITGLLTRQFYRRTDGSGTIAACVAPGERTMAAITDLPADLTIEDVRSIVYRTPYFALDVEPIAGLRVEQIEKSTRNNQIAFTGTLKNSFDVSVDKPSVTIFPLTEAGRPIAVIQSTSDIHIPPNGEWRFETSPVDPPAADELAFPAGALDQ
jgi:hypothetical protein